MRMGKPITLRVLQDIDSTPRRVIRRLITWLAAGATSEDVLILNGDLVGKIPYGRDEAYRLRENTRWLGRMIYDSFPWGMHVLVNLGNWDGPWTVRILRKQLGKRFRLSTALDETSHTIRGVRFVYHPFGDRASPARPSFSLGIGVSMTREHAEDYLEALMPFYPIRPLRGERKERIVWTRYDQQAGIYEYEHLKLGKREYVLITPKSMERAYARSLRGSILLTHIPPFTHTPCDKAVFYWRRASDQIVSITPAYLMAPREAEVEGYQLGKRHAGSKWLRRVLEAYPPQLILSGHVHEAAGCLSMLTLGSVRVPILNAGSGVLYARKGKPGAACLMIRDDTLHVSFLTRGGVVERSARLPHV